MTGALERKSSVIFSLCIYTVSKCFLFHVFYLTIVHYDTSAMKRFLTSVSFQHEPKASDVITLVKKTFVRTSIVRNFISRGVKMRISVREACVKPHLRTRSDINTILRLQYFFA